LDVTGIVKVMTSFIDADADRLFGMKPEKNASVLFGMTFCIGTQG